MGAVNSLWAAGNWLKCDGNRSKSAQRIIRVIALEAVRVRIVSIFLTAFVVFGIFLNAGATTLTDANHLLAPVNRATPSETYDSFIAGTKRLEELYKSYTQEKSFDNLYELRYQFDRLRRLLDLSEVPSANRVKVGNAAITYISDILVRLPPVDPSTIPGSVPGEGTLPKRWTIPGTDIQIARVESGADSGDYLFTPDTIANLHGYYNRVRDLPVLHPRQYAWFHREHINSTGPLVPEWIVERIPESLKVIYLNTPIWKIIAVGLVIIFVLGLSSLWFLIARAQEHRRGELHKLCWRFTVPVVILAIYYLCDRFVISHINPAGVFASGEMLLLTAVFYGLVAWAAAAGCFLIAELMTNTSRIAGNSIDVHMLRLAARVSAIASVGAILIYGANEVGIPAFGLIAGIGVGGFALALAAQSTIENLFGGVALFADRPFRIGDAISFGNERGSVETVGTRSSKIRALDRTLVTVPNSDLAKMKIVNLTQRDKFLFLQKLALRADTRSNQIRVLLQRIRDVMVAEERVEKQDGWPRIRCTGVAIGYIEVELRAHVLTTDYSLFLVVQEALLLDIFELIEELDIKLVTAQHLLPGAKPAGS